MPDPHSHSPSETDRPSSSADPASPDRPSPSPQTRKLKRLSMGIALGVITVIVIEAILMVLTHPLSQMPPLPSSRAIAQPTQSLPDLTPLNTLTTAGDWPAANDETHRLLLEVGDRNNSGWLEDVEVEAFPCQVLGSIDQVWLDASQRRFGFSVQQRLYLQLGGAIGEYRRGAYGLLGQTVGWFRVASEWETTTIPDGEMAFQQPGFSPTTAPIGHLPIGHNAPNGTQRPGQPRQGGGLRGGVLLQTRCDLTVAPNNPGTTEEGTEEPEILNGESIGPQPPDSIPATVPTVPIPSNPTGATSPPTGLVVGLILGAIALISGLLWMGRDRLFRQHQAATSAPTPSTSNSTPDSTADRLRTGDPEAIAQLLNARLQPKGMKAKVVRHNQQLVVGLWAKTAPPTSLVSSLKTFLERRGACPKETIRVMGYGTNQRQAAWSQAVAIAQSQPHPPSKHFSKAVAVDAPSGRLLLGLEWFLVNLLALVLTVLAGSVFVAGLGAVLGTDGLFPSLTYSGMGSWLKSTLALLGLGAIAGLCLGVGQRWVWGRRLPTLRGWMAATIGGLVATVLLFQFLTLVPLWPWSWGLVMAVVLAWMPAFQFWVLRSHLRHAWGWLVGHGVGLLGSFLLAIALWLFWFNQMSDQIEVYQAFFIAMLASTMAAVMIFMGAIALTVHLMVRSLPEQPHRWESIP